MAAELASCQRLLDASMAEKAELEAQVVRMAEEQDRAAREAEATRASLAAKEAEIAAFEEAFRRVGEAANYRIPKHHEESWGDYKRRILELFEAHRESEIVKAILDLLDFRRREAYLNSLSAKTAAEAETHRQVAVATRGCQEMILQALYLRDLRGRREEDLRAAKDFALFGMDQGRLATHA